MVFLSLLFFILLFGALSSVASTYNRLMWRRARAHQWWNQVDQCRSHRHTIVRALLDMSHLPLQHSADCLEALNRALKKAQVATGMELVLLAEMDLTDAIADLENAIDLDPPRYEGRRIRQQIGLLDGADRKLDDSRRNYNESAALLNRALFEFSGQTIGRLFNIKPLPYFHHSRDDQDLPAVAEDLLPPH